MLLARILLRGIHHPIAPTQAATHHPAALTHPSSQECIPDCNSSATQLHPPKPHPLSLPPPPTKRLQVPIHLTAPTHSMAPPHPPSQGTATTHPPNCIHPPNCTHAPNFQRHCYYPSTQLHPLIDPPKRLQLPTHLTAPTQVHLLQASEPTSVLVFILRPRDSCMVLILVNSSSRAFMRCLLRTLSFCNTQLCLWVYDNHT